MEHADALQADGDARMERSDSDRSVRGGDHHRVCNDIGGSGVPSRNVHAVGQDLRREISAAQSLLLNMQDLLGEDDDIIANTVEGETNLVDVIKRALNRVVEINGMIDGIATMSTSLGARSERLGKQRDALKILITVGLETANIKTLESEAATISLRSVPPKVEITDEASIPSKFWKTQDPKLDRKAVLDALKDKQQIPGATLSNGGVTLSIRMN